MQKQFKQIVLIYAALMVGQIIFCMAIILVVTSTADPTPKEMLLGDFFPPLYHFAGIGLAYLLNRTRRLVGMELEGLANKVEHYRTTVIVRSALLEMPNLLSIILTFITGNLNYLLWFCIGLLVFLYFRPSAEQFIRDYALSGKEERELRQVLKI